ncbi:class V lanthionine synthetase subunit LxmK [Amycolatopsis sp. CA-230715]|uniref:class V lanthionine synthetase subunit LxmK n=1 Tax=Amycolatopsis sp. CA-230715 TaxID=2745196 RepID=UPI001C01979F|nr:class V lanthionine synthetase subunit LxmK [Amycolatopsis sp. CA-230715]QWF82522.1 hypothetical protein HUW46_05960 [Amycolatopsis sp. CA-230715]
MTAVETPPVFATLSELAGSEATGTLLRGLGLGGFVPESGVSYLGRNQNCAGRTTAGAEVFVKKIDGAAVQFERAVRFEEMNRERGGGGVRAPSLLGHDERNGLLVFERVLGHRSGAELATDDRITASDCARMGALLGRLHGFPAADPTRFGAAQSVLPEEPALRRLSAAQFVELSAAELELWNLIQYDRVLLAAVDRLREHERAAVHRPIHADLRLDQYLIDGASVYLTDWEEFRLGDPARDVGGFVGEWLYRAVLGIAGNGDDDLSGHEGVLRRGVAEIAGIRPLVSSFWRGYREAADFADAGLAARAVGYAGWHTFERLFASARFGPRLSATQRAVVGVGRTALVRPEKFFTALGLEDHR